MIDIKILRENPELIKSSVARRGGAAIDVDAIVAKDREYLGLMHQTEEMRALRNQLSEQCKTSPEAREKVKQLKVDLGEVEKRLEIAKAEVEAMVAWLPNFLSPEVPDGKSDADNLELRQVGTKPTFTFAPRDHQAIGEVTGIIDTARGAKVAQKGYYYWCGQGALLAQAMFFWAQRELVNRGFTLYMSPCLAKQDTLFGTGYLPFFKDQIYKLENEDLCLVGTSEQTLVGFHGDETLTDKELPAKLTSFTPCFRTEAGSYGKETRGIFRVHQFHKVEQIIVCLPEESPKWHDFCLENEELLLQKLGIPYRVVNVCTGDMGAPGFKKYDVEAWFPGYGGYREVTSNTNLTDFQSRRLGIRFKTADGRKGFVHTISATGVTDRVVCAILENFQQEDGSVLVPECLRPFTGFDRILPAGK
jgi:seryl-tRNA synthetase